ncbi:hypothetical protein OIU78_000876 [Salix suchowensis]|nr:hypothetical protein OIU78_000876 [Salix suchowensis]
MMNQEFWPIIP